MTGLRLHRTRLHDRPEITPNAFTWYAWDYDVEEFSDSIYRLPWRWRQCVFCIVNQLFWKRNVLRFSSSSLLTVDTTSRRRKEGKIAVPFTEITWKHTGEPRSFSQSLDRQEQEVTSVNYQNERLNRKYIKSISWPQSSDEMLQEWRSWNSFQYRQAYGFLRRRDEGCHKCTTLRTPEHHGSIVSILASYLRGFRVSL
jgi:hypothetical protein